MPRPWACPVKHIRALDANLEPVDVGSDFGYHNGPQCAICGEFRCMHCGDRDTFDTEKCEGPEESGPAYDLIEQLQRYAKLAERRETARDEEQGKRLEAEKQVKRLEIVAAQEHRGHALAKANQANADYREALAKAEIARLEAELVELRNAEPS